MSIRPPSFWFLVLAVAVAAPARAGNLVYVVDVNAKYYGYAESSDPIPNIGSAVTPITAAPGGGFDQLTLNAGLYRITNNAATDPGALYDAFQYSQATNSNNWTWNFLITHASDNKVLLFGGRDVDIHPTQADAANAAKAYEDSFAIISPNTVLNFMIRDNSLGDNSGGVSLRIERIADLNFPNDPNAVPEPAALAMLALGALLPVGILARRRRAG